MVSRRCSTGSGPKRPRAVEVMNPSFPSGHAMLSAVVFLTIGVLSAHFAQRKRVKVYVMAAAISVALLIGLTRVYLGVHWPSDVLAGWSLGAAWALACWLAARALELRWRTPRPVSLRPCFGLSPARRRA